MIAITFALPAESSEFLKRLGNEFCADRNGLRTTRGIIADREIEVLHTGVGERVCRERLEKFLQDQQFDLLISSGFAGALDDQLEPGDLLLAKNFSTIHLNDKRSFSSLRIHIADLLTVSALIDSCEERNKIARTSGAAAVDMETEFIARACAEHGVPMLSLRIITDTPREPFPAPPKVLFDIQQQRTHVLNLGTFFLAHPNRITSLVQFARRIARARKILASALVAIVRSQVAAIDPNRQGGSGEQRLRSGG
jgi:nucleoside phosphorylase